METTLEVRWFFEGMPPAVVQHWFRLECPGKRLETSEIRKDWYAAIDREHLNLLTKCLSNALSRQQVNLKLRQKNLELKLRQQEFGTYRFSSSKPRTCEGKIEQWCKLGEEELLNFALPNLQHEIDWIGVEKEREQKIEQGVKSELTWLKIDRECWWTVAFEMTRNKFDKQQDSRFQNVVERACQAYYGPQLLATNSFGYSQWLVESPPQTMSNKEYKINL
jgi:hypothetical protein